MAKQDNIGSKGLITPMAGTGFAFSSAPGANNKLINDTLGNRFKNAIATKLFPEMNVKRTTTAGGSQKEESRLTHSGDI